MSGAGPLNRYVGMPPQRMNRTVLSKVRRGNPRMEIPGQTGFVPRRVVERRLDAAADRLVAPRDGWRKSMAGER